MTKLLESVSGSTLYSSETLPEVYVAIYPWIWGIHGGSWYVAIGARCQGKMKTSGA